MINSTLIEALIIFPSENVSIDSWMKWCGEIEMTIEYIQLMLKLGSRYAIMKLRSLIDVLNELNVKPFFHLLL